MSNQPQYWFPAKRYGWGWGLPSAWQGWAVLVGFFVLLGVGSLSLSQWGPALFAVYVVGLSLVLLAICWLKGEPPSWRWGEK